MSTKSYECSNCGIKDYEMSMNEPEKKECIYCKSPLTRVFSATPTIWNTTGACGKIKK